MIRAQRIWHRRIWLALALALPLLLAFALRERAQHAPILSAATRGAP
jgi:hypothetical protein